MKEISLTKGKTAFISDIDYERVSQHSWCMTPHGYAKARINKKYVLMHRWIMGAKDGEMMDHVNGNKLDNQRENLRLCTCSQNFANKATNANSISGYKGVTWNKDHGKYRARLTIHRAEIFLGYFEDPKDAARAYDRSAREHFGEFAHPNFLEESYA